MALTVQWLLLTVCPRVREHSTSTVICPEQHIEKCRRMRTQRIASHDLRPHMCYALCVVCFVHVRVCICVRPRVFACVRVCSCCGKTGAWARAAEKHSRSATPCSAQYTTYTPRSSWHRSGVWLECRSGGGGAEAEMCQDAGGQVIYVLLQQRALHRRAKAVLCRTGPWKQECSMML